MANQLAPIFVGTLFMAAPCSEAQCPQYDIQVLPQGCGLGEVSVWDVSESGTVVGDYFCVFSDFHPYFWNGGAALTTIPLPPERPHGYAERINSKNHIVGSMNDPSSMPYHAFLYDGSSVLDLGTLPGDVESQARALNDLNVVCGYSNGREYHAVIWQPDIMDLNVSVGPINDALDINNKNQVVGYMGVFFVPPFVSYPFLWENGVTTNLGFPKGGITGSAASINNDSDIVGYYFRPNPNGPGYISRGLLWTNGQTIEIDPLAGFTRSSAGDINDNGVIIGSCDSGPGSSTAFFVFIDGTTYNLNDLIPTGPGVPKSVVISAINNQGQIGASGTDQSGNVVGLVLTPIPPMPGDANCDKVVDVDDLLVVINGWGTCKKFAPCPGDLMENDVVDVDDLLIVINNWTP